MTEKQGELVALRIVRTFAKYETIQYRGQYLFGKIKTAGMMCLCIY